MEKGVVPVFLFIYQPVVDENILSEQFALICSGSS